MRGDPQRKEVVMAFVTFIHSVLCILMVIAILMQSGRGGGLTEAFSSAESMFGAKTNVLMVRITGVLATLFLVTSLTLAYFSARKEQSLIPNTVTVPAKPASAAIPSADVVPAPSPEAAPAAPVTP